MSGGRLSRRRKNGWTGGGRRACGGGQEGVRAKAGSEFEEECEQIYVGGTASERARVQEGGRADGAGRRAARPEGGRAAEVEEGRRAAAAGRRWTGSGGRAAQEG